MTDHPNKNFLYQNWRQSKNANQRHHKDERSTVSIVSSVGPYKNTYGDFVMQKNSLYYWQVKIIQGNYFKIGIMKEDAIEGLGKKAFSDVASGYSYFSTGKLRNGSNTTGIDFGYGYGPGDVVKVQFNTKEGTLKFCKNQENMKAAFTVADFKKGGYVAAVAAMMEGSKYSLTLPGLED